MIQENRPGSGEASDTYQEQQFYQPENPIVSSEP